MLDNLSYLESIYGSYRRNPQSVSAEWRDYFNANGNGATHPAAQSDVRDESLNEKLHELIRHFRTRGHLLAKLDPLGAERPCPPELKLEFYNFAGSELDTLVNLPTLHFETP